MKAALLCSALCIASVAANAASYPDVLLDDIKHVTTAPSRWEQADWRNAGLATLAVFGTAALVDRPLRDEMRRQSGNSNIMRQVERFGADYSLGVLGGFYLAGTLANDENATTVAQDGLAASLIASGLVTPALKFLTGRSRPSQNAGLYNFRPFSGSASFPSGHTTQAFAVASVIAAHYDSMLIKGTSYGIAGMVGLARTYHDAHFASDVVAGALIGTLIGHSIVSYNNQLRSQAITLMPEITRSMAGMKLTGNF